MHMAPVNGHNGAFWRGNFLFMGTPWVVGSLSFSGEFVPGICITRGNFLRGSVCVHKE